MATNNNLVLDEELKLLIIKKDWKEIIEWGRKLSNDDKIRLIWSWPTEKNLNFFKNISNELNFNTILSIGCGSGLLEWIIMESTGINIIGLERDEDWWTSKHSSPTFLELKYINDTTELTEDFYKNCTNNSNNFALLFCYFNNMIAFHNYLNVYENFGKYLIIIGPNDNKNIFTEPLPFDLGLKSPNDWVLWRFCEFGESNDYLTIYIKT